jgi:serine/threonine protein kinase
MEYWKHGDLCTYLAKLKEWVSENVAWKFFIQIWLGIYALHSKNVLHRDLKTLNIFLTMDNSVRIGDLGVATVLNPNEKFLVKKVGTPYYLSPEVCEDKPYNHKCDIWSLGCILYEIWALKHPFEAKTQAELMIKIIKGKYKRIPKKFTKHLSDMVHWLLTKNSKKRPSIEEIILHPLFQKKAVQLRIPLPIRPKEVILPGDDLKLTGGCFDTDDFAMKQNLTSEVKTENTKKKIRGSDVTKRASLPVVKVTNKINKCFRYDYSYPIIIWKIITYNSKLLI